MRTIVWAVTALILLLWSGLAWITYELLGVGGNLVATNADIVPVDPILVEWASWLANAGTGVGEWLVVALWLIVSAIILAVGFAVTRFLPRLSTALPRR
jgi:hypothetical protein